MDVPIIAVWKCFIYTVIKILVVRKDNVTPDIVELGRMLETHRIH